MHLIPLATDHCRVTQRSVVTVGQKRTLAGLELAP